MDALLKDLQIVCEQLLPIVGTVVLIFLCIFLNKLIKLVISITKTIDNLEGTIKLVDTSLEKVQTPLDTAVKVSHTVDNVHDTTVENVKKAQEFINENMDNVKNFINEKITKENNHE